MEWFSQESPIKLIIIAGVIGVTLLSLPITVGITDTIAFVIVKTPPVIATFAAVLVVTVANVGCLVIVKVSVEIANLSQVLVF